MAPFLISIVALFTPLQVASAVPEPVQAIEVDHVYTKLEVASIISAKALEAGVNVDVALAVSKCESGWNNLAVGDSGSSKGAWQINKAHGIPDEISFDPIASTDFAMEHLKKDPEIWTCWRNLVK